MHPEVLKFPFFSSAPSSPGAWCKQCVSSSPCLVLHQWCIGGSSTDCKQSVTTRVAFCPSRLVQAVSQVLLKVSQVLLKVSQVLHILRLLFVQPILLLLLVSGAPFPLSYLLLASCFLGLVQIQLHMWFCLARFLINDSSFLHLVQKLHALFLCSMQY